MISKVLVANRGEIAIRVIRACKEMGIKTVAVFSEADADSLHVSMADEACCIGPNDNARSYLNIPNIISAALLCEADALHPGYGNLSEKAHFAEICEEHNIEFIGPPASAIEQMGDKAAARRLMMDAGVPVVPGSPGPVTSLDEAAKVAAEVGYPVLIKASAGGGGKGLRLATTEEELTRLIVTAATEAEASFGSREVYIEKFIEDPRHVEIQILADKHGNVVHLGERDCSVQRRRQKMIEEAPSPILDRATRESMADAAVRAALAVGYVGAGTVEFIVDRHGHWYFIEMNTRIQVEHPVTEMITGIDIVKEQIRIASGERLRFSQVDVTFRGHAIECRLNAEDSDNGFMSSPGTITKFVMPGGPGVRLDTYAFTGCRIPPFYDSMFGKLIVWAETRDEAIARMARALDEIQIEGIKTTIPFHRRMIRSRRFRDAQVYTNMDPMTLLDDEQEPEA